MADLRIPTSAIHGAVSTAGSAGVGPFVQLKNASASLYLYVFELRIGYVAGSGTSRVRAGRNATPLTMGGTTTTGHTERLDSRNTTAITAVLQACDTVVGTPLTEAQCPWFDRIPSAGTGSVEPYIGVVLKPQSFPWIVAPGTAIEILNPDVGTGNLLRVRAVWDEI